MRQAVLIILIGFLSACAGDAAAPRLDDALFHDEFTTGETADWLLEGDALGRAAIVNEQLLLEVNAPNTIQFATLNGMNFSDLALEVDVTQLAGSLESSYGVLFRMQGPDAFYRFEITGNGLYMAERRNADGTWTQFLDDWTEAAAINQGLRATNHLRVAAMGAGMAFYVNGVLLFETSDVQYATGTIALDGGTFGQPGLQVVFDNVVVRQP
ncbi:MAG: hypothetical protein ACE5E7_03615 [Anaerolineae bacterium]